VILIGRYPTEYLEVCLFITIFQMGNDKEISV
jgi:hypothetical protein